MRMMVAFTFKPGTEETVMALVPQEQARVRELREAGSIEALYLGEGRVGGWIVMQGESAAAVDEALASLPMHPYMETRLTPLR